MWKKICLAAALVCWVLVAEAQTNTITIGAIYNLSGRQSLLDTYSLNGANLAVAQINAAGGILGRPLQLIVLNGETEPGVIIADAEELGSNKNVVAVIGLNSTDMALAAIPTLAKYHKLFITSGATTSVLTKLMPGWMFLAGFSNEQQATSAAEFAFNVQHYKTGTLLVQKDSQYASLLAKSFQDSYQKLGGKIIAVKEFRQDRLKLAKLLTRLKETEIPSDFIYLAVDPSFSVQAIQQIRQVGFEQPIIGGDSLDTIPLRQQAHGAHWPGVIYYTTHAFVDEQNPNLRVQKFILDYQNLFHQLPDGSFAALGFDTIQVLAEAIKRAGSTDPEKIRLSLKNIKDFEGVTGVMAFSDSFFPKKSITLMRLEHGESSQIRER